MSAKRPAELITPTPAAPDASSSIAPVDAAAPRIADFLDSQSPFNSSVTLVVAHAWARTSMPVEDLAEACMAAFPPTAKKMKNAIFGIVIANDRIKPALTVYRPKDRGGDLRLHITGTKSWTDMYSTVEAVAEVARSAGHTFAVQQPEVDLANLRFTLQGLDIRKVTPHLRARHTDFYVPPQQLQPGKALNISNDEMTILLWASGSLLTMLKRVKRGAHAQSALNTALDIVASIETHCCGGADF